MISLFRRPIVLAAFVAIGLLGTSARADLIITVQENSGAVQTFTVAGSPSSPGGVSGATSFTTPDYSISILSGKETQLAGPPPISELQSATVSVTNTTGGTGDVLHITVTGTGYTAPTAPPNISGLSHIGATFSLVTATDSLAFQSLVPTAVFAAPGPFTPQSDTFSAPGSFSNDQNRTITALGAPYTITETYAVVLNEKNDTINFSGSTTLTGTVVPPHVIPEPSTMALAGLGGLGLIGYGLRRRARGA
jgi:hypothetical protein